MNELNYENGEHHIFDYFHQKIGRTNKDLYIFQINDILYYRLFKIGANKKILCKYFKWLDNTFIKVNDKTELATMPNIEQKDVDFIKYCNYYGKIDIGNKVFPSIEKDVKKVFKIIDLNIDTTSTKSLIWRKGKNCSASGTWTFKGSERRSKSIIGELNSDLISFIFDIPSIKNVEEPINQPLPYINLKYKPGGSELKSINLLLEQENINLFNQLEIACLESECLLRYIRDIHKYATEALNRNITPQYWFYNYNESLIQKYLEKKLNNNKLFVRQNDDVYKFCTTLRNIVSNNDYKSNEGDENYYFNEEGKIFSEQDKRPKKSFLIKKFAKGINIDIINDGNITGSGIIDSINQDGTYNILVGQKNINVQKEIYK